MRNVSTLCLTLALIAAGLIASGCMTSKQTTVDANGQTNTVVVVNQANLDLDCAAIQTVTSGVVATLAKNTNNLAILRSVHTALDGILNGANPQTVQEALTLLKIGDNPSVATQATALLNSVSAIEQQLLQKYGQSVAGQITLAVAKAVDNGFMIGLQSP